MSTARIRGKAEDGAGHGGGQRDIAAGIVDGLQQLQEDLDLGGLQQIAARARVAGDAALLQRSLVHARHDRGRAHEDNNIRRARGAQRAVLRYKRAAVQKLRDARGDELGLRAGLVAGIVVRGGQVKAVQLDLGAPLLREARAGDEGFGLRIVELARLFFHDEGKDVVGSLQDLCARAEILRQQELARLAGGLCAAHGIGGVFLQEDRGVGQTEAVDRLLDVADEEKVLPFPADGLENTLLHGVGVLIFVDQDLAVGLREAPRGGGGRAGVLFRQQADHAVLEVGEIEKMAAAFFLPSTTRSFTASSMPHFMRNSICRG